jgi:hypothetical protein
MPRIASYSQNKAAIYIRGFYNFENSADTALLIKSGVINDAPAFYKENRAIDGDNNFVDEPPLNSFYYDYYASIRNESSAKVVIDNGYDIEINGVVAILNPKSDLILKGGEIRAISVIFDAPNPAVYSVGSVFLGASTAAYIVGQSTKLYGGIMTEKEKLHVIPGFNPQDNFYVLNTDYSNGDIAVVGGAEFIESFKSFTGGWTPPNEFEVVGKNIVVKDGGKVSLTKPANNKAASFAFAGIRNGQINLQLKAGNYTAELYDLRGRMISRVEINAINGINSTGLKTGNLSKGIFILNLKQAGNSVLQQKISVK